MFQLIVLLLSAILISVVVAYLSVKRWGGSVIKVGLVGSFLSVVAAFFSLLFHGFGIDSFRTVVLSGLFLYGSYGDIKTHEADDWIHFFILVTALIAKPFSEIPMALLSAFILGGVMALVAMFVRGAGIGGADIKFTAACAFLTNLQGGLLGLGLGTFIALLFNSPFFKKRAEKGFPMLPYLSCSYILVYLLS